MIVPLGWAVVAHPSAKELGQTKDGHRRVLSVDSRCFQPRRHDGHSVKCLTLVVDHLSILPRNAARHFVECKVRLYFPYLW